MSDDAKMSEADRTAAHARLIVSDPRKVQGHCPMGCGATLFLGSGGYVTCSYYKCPRPDAAADLLLIAETEHIVVIGAETFDIAHPLRERLRGELWNCGLHQHLRSLAGPPFQPGKYRVYWRDGRCGPWVVLPGAEAEVDTSDGAKS